MRKSQKSVTTGFFALNARSPANTTTAVWVSRTSMKGSSVTGWASHVPSLVGESMAVAKPSSHDCRATITGTRAACKTALLTDPRSMPVKPPRP
ncbi:Uncharacterised protein [Mycobacterium tuberculosis]|uniref:Uncharacterized protein n=1 Tax=Mycobacterium tuberculosis TaxID=1773 RepID=A0A916LDS9_MYCTX|nr:Uncharacterised protein [Mycobacterium tuberculosis]COX62732.1 Uncharacterised protein [Mycobacterium tuberculosis]COY56125.1 Uncharacterised protein [Mycobacterium tuberculosis]COZ21493.1 Uncharacterised protein [Mycobacterium tuberculosis]